MVIFLSCLSGSEFGPLIDAPDAVFLSCLSGSESVGGIGASSAVFSELPIRQ